LIVALVIGANAVFAHHIPMPNLPIGETAYNIGEFLNLEADARGIFLSIRNQFGRIQILLIY